MPLVYWLFAMRVASYLLNSLPTKVLYSMSPFQVLFSKPPDYANLKVFRCECFPCVRAYNSNKLEPRAITCVFMWYCVHQRGFCVDRHNG